MPPTITKIFRTTTIQVYKIFKMFTIYSLSYEVTDCYGTVTKIPSGLKIMKDVTGLSDIENESPVALQ